MVARVTDLTHLPYQMEELVVMSGSESPFVVQGALSPWCIRDVNQVLKFKVTGLKRVIVVYAPPPTGYNMENYKFVMPRSIAYSNSYFFHLIGAMSWKDKAFNGIVMLIGSSEFTAMIHHTLKPLGNDCDYIGDAASAIERPLPPPVLNITMIKKAQLIAFKVSENKLYPILRDTNVPLNSRILTALLTLFPYIAAHISRYVTVVNIFESDQDIHNAQEEAFLHTSDATNGFNIGLLGLYVLGRAYSNRDRLAGQIAKRVAAVAIPLETGVPTEHIMQNIVSSVQWSTQKISPVVDDVLGLVLCPTVEGEFNIEATKNQIRSSASLREANLVGQIGSLLLDQARMVYHNYHSSSIRFIHFIAAVLPPLFEVLGQDNAILRDELHKYRQIEHVLQNSPYMGMCSQAPQQYHIKNFPLLVHTAVEYFKQSAASEAEKQLANEYTVGDLSIHLANKDNLLVMNILLPSLSPPTITTLCEFVRILPARNAEIVLARRSEVERQRILDILRYKTQPGEWAEHQIAKENAVYMNKLIDRAVTFLTETLNARYTSIRDVAETIQDRDERTNRIQQTVNWKNEITRRIQDLRPFTDVLPSVPRATQNHIKTTVVERLEAIMAIIKTE